MSTAARTTAVSPPPIGEALRVAWAAYQRDMGPIAIATLCGLLPAVIPIFGGGPAMAGMLNVGRKALRGQTPTPADGFVGLTQNAVDHAVMGLLQVAGVLACCVGMYVTQAVFYPGSLLILDRGIGWEQAKDECVARVWPNWGAWTLFTLVVVLAGGSGMILCGIGIVLTAPVAMIALAYGYERAFGPAAPPAG